MPRGVYERPTYNVKCVMCGIEYTQSRLPVSSPKCSKCQKKVNGSKYYLSHKEQIRDYQQRPEVIERKKVSDKKYYDNNKEKISEKQRQYYVKNRDKILSSAERRRRELGEKPNGLSGTETVALSILKELFPTEEILQRDRTVLLNPKTNTFLELDFYIPSLKLAIELNGITHYKPIYGKEKFERQVRNDKIKRDLCLNMGITLVVVPLDEGVHYDRYDREHKKLRETLISYLPF